MSDSGESPVFMFDHEDPAMGEATRRAQETFRYFWRELSWEGRRIVPALGVACVKAAFSDEGSDKVEHMWLQDVGTDGTWIFGELLNQPNWLKSVKQGDGVKLPLNRLGDWIYSVSGRAYGAFTVNLLRSRMSEDERAQHDEAWGLDFGDPTEPQVWPTGYGDPQGDHPMAVNMAPSLKEQLAKSTDLLQPDDHGWTILHHEALAGNRPTVAAILEHGGDPQAKTADGQTPIALARALGWESVVELLLEHTT